MQATPCSAPARNQYWMPICVTNGVKLNTIAVVPRLAARTTAAQAARRGYCEARATRNCDIGLVGYQTTLLVERAGQVLTPALVAELKAGVVA